MTSNTQLEQHLKGANRASQGVRNVPDRLRIQISRRRNDDEDAKVRQFFSRGRLLFLQAYTIAHLSHAGLANSDRRGFRLQITLLRVCCKEMARHLAMCAALPYCETGRLTFRCLLVFSFNRGD